MEWKDLEGFLDFYRVGTRVKNFRKIRTRISILGWKSDPFLSFSSLELHSYENIRGERCITPPLSSLHLYRGRGIALLVQGNENSFVERSTCSSGCYTLYSFLTLFQVTFVRIPFEDPLLE